MMKHWVISILSAAIIFTSLIGPTAEIKTWTIVVMGLTICFVSLREIARRKISKKISENIYAENKTSRTEIIQN
ncbi:MAG: hypothetical protein L6Q29_01840 [Candidatus Pacebacteria bacterium]|nr:hypothetical protein [Candidatus Paceibacterota bacterium]